MKLLDKSYRVLDSTLGPLAVVATVSALCGLVIGGSERQLRQRLAEDFPTAVAGDNALLQLARAQIAEYFAGARRDFSLAVDLSGQSPFHREVLTMLMTVPYGTTVSYARLAALAGRPAAARAVGAAMAANPLPLVIPCHRVVGANGALVGYSGAGGVATKRWLLDFESEHLR